MVVEMEADMDGVIQGFDLRLDRDGGGRGSDASERFFFSGCLLLWIDGCPAERLPDRGCLRGSVRGRAGGSDRSRSGGGGGGTEGKEEVGGGGGAVKERIARALRIYKEAAAGDGGGGGALVQVWAPARDGGRRVLATRGQPFVLAPPQCHRLFQYRTVSLTHAFPVGGAGVPGERGLPGRVFDAGAPEWTPNVQYYGTGEYARISYALIYDIQAALALPILDPGTGSCVAVVELVTTSPRLRFAAEVDKLSKALQVTHTTLLRLLFCTSILLVAAARCDTIS